MAEDGKVVIAQVLPQRVRFVAARLVWHRGACERVARALAAGGGFDRVKVRPATGSVIVEGSAGSFSPEALAAKLEDLVGSEHDDAGRELGALGPDDHPGPTRIARAVVRAASAINDDVRAALDDKADLGTILPVVFAAVGAFEVAASGRLPVPTWFNLLWWSLRSFMTFNIRAVEEEVQGVSEPDMRALAGGL